MRITILPWMQLRNHQHGPSSSSSTGGILISLRTNSISSTLRSRGTFSPSPSSSTSKYNAQLARPRPSSSAATGSSTTTNPSHSSKVNRFSIGVQLNGPRKCPSDSARLPCLTSYVSLSTYIQFKNGGLSRIVDTNPSPLRPHSCSGWGKK